MQRMQQKKKLKKKFKENNDKLILFQHISLILMIM